MKRWLMRPVITGITAFACALATSFSISAPLAQAATVTATGTNSEICNQSVTDATNVVAYRISGGDCVVEFRNVGSTNWTSPSHAPLIQILVVGGGGGGGARHAGGGGGGGMFYILNYKVLANTSYAIAVGDGGAGAPGLTVSGGGRAGASSSFGGTSGTGSIVANGGGGGGGGGDVANSLNFDGTSNIAIARGSGGGTNGDTSPGGTVSPGSASGTVRTVVDSTMTVNGVTATVKAYAQAGANGKQNYCYGSSVSYTAWCGGGGGGSWLAGGAPTQPGSVNPWKGGNGGAGASIPITGTNTAYAGGGGGSGGTDITVASNAACVANSPAAGDGGAGGGGAGGQCLNTASSGVANTGGGGGGGGLAYVTGNGNTQGVGGKGGSGIVIVRYTPDTTTSIGALSLSGTAFKGNVVSLTLSTNTPGRVRFFVNGKRIANCLSVATTGSAPTYTATCSWKPTISSRQTLSAAFTPTDNTFASANAAPNILIVTKRSGYR